ncbi:MULTISPECIES: MFS transporter [unclassified Shinella]|uniref:MFS transporter n=1 Tax=unclassified Shinella TaxID=2643062 RepID=UPI00225CCFC3|nr:MULTISPECIES: MFS transporter [unclassified Shinella]CAI0334142.1 membrane hypothetical protein [Rhizobiaceae bacterium]CAK7261796.1 membrane protein of unknown function [Shinella sp. WSC3-e]MDC7259706.1 MFS transporter [Shinella sp. YE25]MDC7266886.1 MFS transporter [Shinella sp. HY16]MDC7273783.1 MFS transporter [Shinella sp. YZ44]
MLSKDSQLSEYHSSSARSAAVTSMAVGAFGLVGSEFLPTSLLTTMAADLNDSEGAVGQAVTATAVPALIASLLVTFLTRNLDRKNVIICFSLLLIILNVIVALSPSIWMVLAGRVFLGLALGGFWTLSLAITGRLVREEYTARALSIVMFGISAATVLAPPAGSFLGDLIGWRGVFLVSACLGGLALVGQIVALPRLPPQGPSHLVVLVAVARRPGIAAALVSVLLIFTGHFAFFTYIRPFLEMVTHLGGEGISTFLLGFGMATFAANYLGAYLFEKSMRPKLAAMPCTMGILALFLLEFGRSFIITGRLLTLWGSL